MSNNIEPLPDDLILNTHMEDIERVRNGRWLSIDGEDFEIIKILDERRDVYYQIHIRKLDKRPDEKGGYVGAFFRRDATLKFDHE